MSQLAPPTPSLRTEIDVAFLYKHVQDHYYTYFFDNCWASSSLISHLKHKFGYVH